MKRTVSLLLLILTGCIGSIHEQSNIQLNDQPVTLSPINLEVQAPYPILITSDAAIYADSSYTSECLGGVRKGEIITLVSIHNEWAGIILISGITRYIRAEKINRLDPIPDLQLDDAMRGTIQSIVSDAIEDSKKYATDYEAFIYQDQKAIDLCKKYLFINLYHLKQLLDDPIDFEISVAIPQEQTSDWENICSGPDSNKISYCKNVGKNAYNATGSAVLREVNLGIIIGVCWRPKGSIIGYSQPIPAANIPAEIRRAPRNAYYYIIDDSSEKPFLRECREIEAKDPS